MADALVEGRHADRVLLANDQIRQARSDGAGVIVLIERAVAVVHRIADIDDEMRPQIRLGFVLLDVEFVGFRPDFPVEMPKVVARRVVAVLDELDAVPEEGTLVHAGQETLDDLLRPQLQRRDTGDRLGMQKPTRIVFRFDGHFWTRSWGREFFWRTSLNHSGTESRRRRNAEILREVNAEQMHEPMGRGYRLGDFLRRFL